MTVRVRFAPAPTGLLHLGNARTALFNYVFARGHGGTFILRIEDTDVERSTDASVDRILEDLRWLGIEWEEGPDKEGPEGPYRQSQRLPLYQEYVERLLDQKRLYKCFCSPERLESLRREQLSKGMMPRYDGHCRGLSEAEVLGFESEGRRPAIRFLVKDGSVLFEDLVHGKMKFDLQGIGDFIAVRSDGMAAYNFACVVDDHAMRVSHVIRGEDHLSNTPRQIMIYQTLGWSPPAFAHHPLILGPDRTPLSKRHGATAVSQYREDGFLPEALQNYLLGGTAASGDEILPLDKIAQSFSFKSVSRSAPVFDRKKLEWLNTQAIRKMEEDRLSGLLLPYLLDAGIPLPSDDGKTLKRISTALRDNLGTLSQVKEYLGIFFDGKFSFEDEARSILSSSSHQETLRTIHDLLEGSPEITDKNIRTLFSQMEEKTGRKGKALFAPLRASVTGKTKGPELAQTLPLLGRERILKRLEKALELCDKGGS